MSYPTSEVLEAYVAKDLPALERIRLWSHLRNCTSCALRVADLRWAVTGMRPEETTFEIQDSHECGGMKNAWAGGWPRDVLLPARA